jgi:hypothetical protein
LTRNHGRDFGTTAEGGQNHSVRSIAATLEPHPAVGLTADRPPWIVSLVLPARLVRVLYTLSTHSYASYRRIIYSRVLCSLRP